MILSELADLVIVRNHINVVLNDKSVTTKNDFRALNDVRTKLDKKFVEVIKNLDLDTIHKHMNISLTVPEELITYTNITQTTSDSEFVSNVWNESNQQVVEEPINTAIELSITEEPKTEIDNTIALADDDTISKRLQAQKEQLKKEGRSNKRISK
jgi:hypothetical protein